MFCWASQIAKLEFSSHRKSLGLLHPRKQHNCNGFLQPQKFILHLNLPCNQVSLQLSPFPRTLPMNFKRSPRPFPAVAQDNRHRNLYITHEQDTEAFWQPEQSEHVLPCKLRNSHLYIMTVRDENKTDLIYRMNHQIQLCRFSHYWGWS